MFTKQHAAAARDSAAFLACMGEVTVRDLITCDDVIQQKELGWIPVIYLCQNPETLPPDIRKKFPESVEVEPGLSVPILVCQLTP